MDSTSLLVSSYLSSVFLKIVRDISSFMIIIDDSCDNKTNSFQLKPMTLKLGGYSDLFQKLRVTDMPTSQRPGKNRDEILKRN